MKEYVCVCVCVCVYVCSWWFSVRIFHYLWFFVPVANLLAIFKLSQNFLSYHLSLVCTEHPQFSYSVHLPWCNITYQVSMCSWILLLPGCPVSSIWGHWLGLLRLCLCTCTHVCSSNSSNTHYIWQLFFVVLVFLIL